MTNTNLDMNNPTSAARNVATYARAASTICLLAGIWFFVSPWVYGAAGTGNAWNSWIVGAVMFIVAVVRLSSPLSSTALSWLNTILGIWAFFSPWIYGYASNTGRFINSLWRDRVCAVHCFRIEQQKPQHCLCHTYLTSRNTMRMIHQHP